jgi:pyruvate dehydrogenase E2 component (dihydrolipoamide acetyltransferase)
MPAAVAQPAVQPPAAPARPAAPAVPAIQEAGDELVPMTPMRKKIAERMVESRRTSAHVHTVFKVDMTRIVALREKTRRQWEERNGVKLTYTPFVAKALMHGIRVKPIVNASVVGDNILYHKHVNLGIAVALDWGLIVPVVKGAENLSFVGLQRAITDVGTRARNKKLLPDEVQGGTITITNPGIFGPQFGTPIILQPQVAILGMGGIFKEPVVITDKDGNDSIAIRHIIRLTLGYDHRIIDGAEADQFMVAVRDYLENFNEDLG